MTHPNFQTNGASLEDCHTNFFALTELSGIKWRKLTWSEPGGGSHGPGHGSHHIIPGDPLDDPVLRSYARCLAADILCVWRRVSSCCGSSRPPPDSYDAPLPPTQPPPLSLASAKELWIFWYGEEPDLSDLIAPELNMNDCEQGSWESGLSYECRSLLFKALHNLIERCLLSRDFIRLGKWFVQPYDYPAPRFDPADNDDHSSSDTFIPPPPTANHLSFSFAFFVHGESSVCASVDVRQHPSVRRLTRWHLQEAQAITGGIKVILAPFGLSGTLTGQSFRSPESTAKFLDDWSHFYPLDKSSSLTDSSVVEVIVGGVKMRYPSCYVLVTDLDDHANQSSSNLTGPLSGSMTMSDRTMKLGDQYQSITIPTPPASPNEVQINSRVPQLGPHSVSVEHINSMSRDPTAAQILPERTWQQCFCAASEKTKEEGSWDFVEPSRKTPCSCVKPRKYISSSSSKWSQSNLSMSASLLQRPQKASKGRIPFHRRSPVSPYVVSGRPQTPQNNGAAITPAPSTESRSNFGGSYTPQGGPPSYPRTQDSMIVNSVGSPASVAPSPLQGPHSQPASVPPGDATMPTLSPNPPISDQSPLVGADKSHTPPDSVRLAPKSMESPAISPNCIKSEPESRPGDKRHIEDSEKVNGDLLTLKRPILTSKEYEVALGEEEHTLDMLYDYSTQDAWFNHPVKRFKPDCKENKFNKKMDIYSLYPHNVISICNTMKQEIKQESGTVSDVEALRLTPQPHGVKRPGDPYEFGEDDGNNLNSCKIDGFTRTPPIKDEPKDNLFTDEGLQVTYDQLENIFDNSDYTSSDEAQCFPQIQIQTPPGSAGPTVNHIHSDDALPPKRLSGHNQTNLGGCPNVGMPPELSKMFPTPPSLEHNPIASPCGQFEMIAPDYPDLSIVRIKQENYPMLGSPQEENIEDWSYVFKPPTICKMVGSSKYAPLTNLPSQVQSISLPSNCIYKPSWVQHMENSKNLQNLSNTGSGISVSGASSRNRTPTPSVPNNVHHHPGIFPPSPLHPAGFRPPPPPYEMPSPANSTTSSYLNKNLNSVEPVPTPQPNHRTAEASSLVLNILLTDTAFNIFRDHNFDSCTLCVCNASPKVVGNIRGADAGIYLLNSHNDKLHASAQSTSPYPGLGQPPPYTCMSPQHSSEEDQVRCSCGFSAVVNRRLAYGSGLFYEDEMEITGIAEDPGDRKKSSLVSLLTSLSCLKPDSTVDRDQLEIVPQNVLDLIKDQLVFIPNTANALCRAARAVRQVKSGLHSHPVHLLEFTDSNEVTCIALEQSKNLMENLGMCKVEDKMFKLNGLIGVHIWPFLKAPGPRCNQDIVRVMKSLQPLLQEAIQKKCQTRLWEAPSAVKGPLTWRQFHRLAGRGTDDRCEPQPIPSVIVGHDKDWLCLSPYALQHWESLLLEPYSYSRDVAYVVVAPDNDAILPRVKTFFKELSTAYEICKLGRHSPITKVLRDGILRVGKTAKTSIGNEPVEEWFSLLGDGETSDMLKLYAQVCKHHLAPHLQQVPMDKTLLDPPVDNMATERPTPSPMPPPSTPDPNISSSQSSSTPDKAPSTPKSDQDGDGMRDNPTFASSGLETSNEDDDREAPSVVVYLVEPFSLGSDQPDMQRLAVLALLRCFQGVLTAVPENIRNNISVQIISLESIVELNKARERMRHSDHMRALALNIFSQCRRLLIHSNNVKSLTGFGTAATADLFLKSKDEKNKAPYRLFTPPYVLAPMRERVEQAEAFGKGFQDQSSVLYISYCLSEDQTWLLAVCTDERGEIFETVTINIDIPNRNRRKKASARRIGLEKLMTFILGVMSQSVRPWRLVVGRLGRIGHGELKGWSWLLSKKNLLKASRHLKEICNQCSMLYPSAVPCILSACLVSLEPDSVLRLMPDQFTPDERFSQVSVNSQLSTPQDVSCTHILVFPTSATTQSSQTAFHDFPLQEQLGDDELFKGLDDDMPEGIADNDINDIFNWSTMGGFPSPTGRDDAYPTSPTGGAPGGMEGNLGAPAGAPKSQEPNEEVGVVLQQPLALGYLVSTAPTGRMPRWFWTSCPHLEGVCPVFLKNALHLHSPNVQQSSDDLFQQAQQVSNHPLDSQFTTDVLRYVLEGYNALSWLALDSNTKDRLSCLPAHMQVLVQLYHTAAALL